MLLDAAGHQCGRRHSDLVLPALPVLQSHGHRPPPLSPGRFPQPLPVHAAAGSTSRHRGGRKGQVGAAQPPSFHVIFGAWVAEGLRIAPDALPVEILSVFHPGGGEGRVGEADLGPALVSWPRPTLLLVPFSLVCSPSGHRGCQASGSSTELSPAALGMLSGPRNLAGPFLPARPEA